MANKYNFTKPEQIPDENGNITGIPFVSFISMNGIPYGRIYGKNAAECSDRAYKIVMFLREQSKTL